MRQIFLLVFTLFHFSLFGLNEEDFIQQNSLINNEGAPSAIVGGCVNAISGDFFDSGVDLKIPGYESLMIQRSYSSSDYFYGTAGSRLASKPL